MDDDEMMLFLAVRTLERLGYGVQGCTSAAEALAVCRQHPAPVDLVVTDLNMPDRSGLDLAADLRALHPDLPVVLSSGCVTPDLEAAARRVGIRGFLDKPTTAGELATVLGRLLPDPRRSRGHETLPSPPSVGVEVTRLCPSHEPTPRP
ncbi:MAG: response regulator [Verrucomicrobia bacterium]|nr:response regulator [Verrucomicrobiota bacterium]